MFLDLTVVCASALITAPHPLKYPLAQDGSSKGRARRLQPGAAVHPESKDVPQSGHAERLPRARGLLSASGPTTSRRENPRAAEAADQLARAGAGRSRWCEAVPPSARPRRQAGAASAIAATRRRLAHRGPREHARERSLCLVRGIAPAALNVFDGWRPQPGAASVSSRLVLRRIATLRRGIAARDCSITASRSIATGDRGRQLRSAWPRPQQTDGCVRHHDARRSVPRTADRGCSPDERFAGRHLQPLFARLVATRSPRVDTAKHGVDADLAVAEWPGADEARQLPTEVGCTTVLRAAWEAAD